MLDRGLLYIMFSHVAPLQSPTTCNDYDDDLLFGSSDYKFSCLYLEISEFVCMRVIDMFNNYDHMMSVAGHDIHVQQRKGTCL